MSAALSTPVRADAPNELLNVAYRGDVARAAVLLDAGAALTDKDPKGLTPLHWAAREGHSALVQLFLERGAPIDAADRDGNTPLMLAVDGAHVGSARLLLAKGASLEPHSRDGADAHLMAVQGGIEDLVVLLEEAEANNRPDWKAAIALAEAERAPATPAPVLVPGKDERFLTIGRRIDALPFSNRPLKPPSARPLASWVGDKFVFLPMEREELREYPSFTVGEARQPQALHNAAYEQVVGRVCTVERVGKQGRDPFIVVSLDDDGTKLYGMPGPFGDFPELGPALDLYLARRMYTGKIVWPRDCTIQRFTHKTGKDALLKIGAWVPAVVEGVFPGENAANPVRLVLRTSKGEQGFLDVTMSGTNAPTGTGARRSVRFFDLFYPRDPRALMTWPTRVWSAIYKSEVFSGMTADQVRASWGSPDRLEAAGAGERWIYGEGPKEITLIFEGVTLARRIDPKPVWN